MPDVRLPNGTIMKNVPEGTPKDEIKRRAIASGTITEKEFSSGPAVQDNEWKFYENRPEAPVEPVEEDRVAGPSVPSTSSMEPYTPLTKVQEGVAEVKSVNRELTRTLYGGAAMPAAQTLVSLVNGIRGLIGVPASEQEKLDQQKGLFDGIMLMSDGRVEAHLDDKGEVVTTRPETLVGNVAPYLLPITMGYKHIQGAKALSKAPALFRNGLAAALPSGLTEQFLTDPKADNIADTIENLFPNKDFQNTFVSYLSTEEEDSETIRRIKMAGQDLLLTGALGGIGTLIGLARKSSNPLMKEFLTRPPESFTKEEAGEIVFDLVSQMKQDAKMVVTPTLKNGKPVYRNGSPVYEPVLKEGKPVIRTYPSQNLPPASPQETAETIKQLERQNGNGPIPFLTRLLYQTTLSRGYFTQEGYKLQQVSDAAKRASIHRAESTSRRLNNSITNIATKSQGLVPKEAVEGLQNKISAALTDPTGKALDLLPIELREDVSLARSHIDNLTRELIDSPTVFTEFKATLSENIGSYLKRSYEIIENPRYVPEKLDVLNATNYLINQSMKADPSLSLDAATASARGRVELILQDKGKEYISFLSNSQKLNGSIYKAREDIPEAIRKLMGEVTNPTDNILLTVKRLTDYVENDKFYRNFYDLGKGKYIFSEPTGIYNVPIEGTGSFLDVINPSNWTSRGVVKNGELPSGGYTSKELLTAIQGRESQWLDPAAQGWGSSLLRNLATFKGTTQSAKTVYSHSVHVVNFLGGMTSRLANGTIPFGSESLQAFRVVAQEVKLGGDKALSDLYEMYLRLGVINTSTTAREMNALIETGLGSPDSVAKWVTEQGMKVGPTTGKIVGAIAEGAPRVYMATDDLFKISQFESELAVLKKAYPNRSVQSLQEEAAEIIKNTLFNYDRVPKGIKALRNLPLGNFVGFPAEVARTSFNIMGQAVKEITSGNATLIARGTKRLVGFTAVAGSGLDYPSTMSMRANGFETEEQQKAIMEFAKTPWSEYPTPIIFRDEETGKVYVADASRLDAYSYFREPVKALFNVVQDGTAKNKDYDEIIKNVVFGKGSVGEAIFSPYLTQSMMAEVFSELKTAWDSDDGRGASGRPYFTPGTPSTEKAVAVLDLVWDLVSPGSVQGLHKLYEASGDGVDMWTGKDIDFESEVMSNVGLRFKEIDLSTFLERSTGGYVQDKKDNVDISVNYNTKPEEVIQYYEGINRTLYRQQQKLFSQVEAVRALGMDEADVVATLRKKGLSQSEIYGIQNGEFIPATVGETLMDNIRERMYSRDRDLSMTAKTLEYELIRMRNLMSNNSLEKFEDEGDKPTGVRVLKALGGVVQAIPQAPSIPAERIDKTTGMPYNLQAGLKEDPLMRLLGAPIKRETFAGGGVVKAILSAFKKEAPIAVKKVAKEEVPSATGTLSREYAEGVEAFGEEGMTSEARMARSLEGRFVDDTFYHGTAREIQAFDAAFLGNLTGAESAKEGFFFSRSPKTTKNYSELAGRFRAQKSLTDAKDLHLEADKLDAKGESIKSSITRRNAWELEDEVREGGTTTGQQTLPVRLRYENPKIIDMDFTTYADSERPRLGEEIKKAKREGYDAVIFENFSDTMFTFKEDVEDATKWLLSGSYDVSEPVKNIIRDTIPLKDLTNRIISDTTEVVWKLEGVRDALLDVVESKKPWSKIPAGVLSHSKKQVDEYNIPEESMQATLEEVDSVLDFYKRGLEKDFADQIVVFKPEQIRSVNATFDPTHKSSSNLLRSLGTAAAGATVIPKKEDK